MEMRTAYDLSPFYRSMIGVDRLSDLVEAATGRDDERPAPSYDVQKTGEDAYRITLATPGFSQDSLEITAQPNLLIVTGRPPEAKAGSYLHRGIVAGAFERRFGLADHVVVKAALRARPADHRPGPRGPRGAEAAADRDPLGAAIPEGPVEPEAHRQAAHSGARLTRSHRPGACLRRPAPT
jgi:molecular chaperone IbpA